MGDRISIAPERLPHLRNIKQVLDALRWVKMQSMHACEAERQRAKILKGYTMKITFAGAAGTVTGSRYVVQHQAHRLLVDCGLFQGYKTLRLRNWAKFPVPVASIHALVLTHAHLDHSGFVPAIVRDGYQGPIFASKATHELCGILLPDSGHLQEEEARYANRHGTSKHQPALPLYTRADAVASLDSIKGLAMDRPWPIMPGIEAVLGYAGHLLGASTVTLRGNRGSIVFSGDLGRPRDSVLRPPAQIKSADYLVIESTYGNRHHEAQDSEQQLGEIIRETAKRGGITIVPSFAVGRAQTLMLAIHRLKSRREIPDIPVYLNSPMAADATSIYSRNATLHHLAKDECKAMCTAAKIVNSVEESMALNVLKAPAVIIAASGMATGGRVLHHLIAYASDPRNSIVFTGYQAGGTRGALIVAGAESVKIFGQLVPIRAQVHQLNGYSAHADADEIMAWLRGFERPPRRVFVTHGELDASDTLRKRIQDELGWRAHAPEHMESVNLSFKD
jgi:metallo-beta-lactamase family protein